jgi:hypothetical protein
VADADAPRTEAERVDDWLFEKIVELGYTAEQALEALATGSDYRTLERLIRAGCDPLLALRIA